MYILDKHWLKFLLPHYLMISIPSLPLNLVGNNQGLLQDAVENQRANLEGSDCSGEQNLQGVRCFELNFFHKLK